MEPTNLAFGGGATETFLNPLTMLWVLITIVLVMTLPRNKVIAPFLFSFFTIPLAQVLVVGGIHFPMLRILILVGLVRRASDIMSSSAREYPGGFSAVDRVVVLWTVFIVVVPCLAWMEPQAFVKFVGDFLDTLGGYLVMRFLIPDRAAVRRTIKVLAVVCLIQGVCMVSEQFTHQNVFAFLGENQPTIREGHVRSEGSMGTLFGGTFAGVLIPMFLWLWKERKSWAAACAGVVGASAMAFASHASTSWMAYGAGLLGLGFWPLRRYMRLIRWLLVATLVGLHLVMHGPVWSLIEKIDLTGGSSSYHRYMLVDNCIRHFSDWWLLGFKHPGIWGFDMWDLCNQFVAVALAGGLISLVLYLSIFSRSFGAIGDARKRVNGRRRQEWLLWCLGATLFANVVASFGINYMLQLLMLLFSLLACVSVVTFEAKRAALGGLKRSSKEQLTRVPIATEVHLPVGDSI
jgi:hypothetical protein